MRTVLVALAATVVPALWPVNAEAHQTGISYGDYDVRADGIDVSMRLSAAEVAGWDVSVRPLRSEAEPKDEQPARRDLVASTLGALRVARGASPCALVPGGAHPELPDGFRVSGAFQCAPSQEPFRVDAAALLARLSWGHTHLAKLTVGARVEEQVLRAGRASFAVAAPAPWLAQVARFLRLGVEHIFTGYDHVAFVVGLVLLGRSVRQVVGVATSFTLAHSVTLAAASLGWVALPSAVVEPLIALSIVFVACENLLAVRHPSIGAGGRRAALAFAFGLLHGFGFAGALTELHLSTGGLAMALLSFNMGVELGQAAIIAAVFPALASLQRWPATVPVLVRAGSLAIGGAGAFWLVQRVPRFWPA